MIDIISKRVEGYGKGKELNFPTINFILNELPQGLSLGLWASLSINEKSISLISKFKNKFRIETHILTNYSLIVKVDEKFKVTFLKKLREPILSKDIIKLIENDKKMIADFFTNQKTCLECNLCFKQDEGYSNYTVTDTYMGCYANVFNEKYEFNITKYNSIDCKLYTEGEYLHIDVEGESAPTQEWIDKTTRDIKLKKILNNI